LISLINKKLFRLAGKYTTAAASFKFGWLGGAPHFFGGDANLFWLAAAAKFGG
jgi:hypothetical protein